MNGLCSWHVKQAYDRSLFWLTSVAYGIAFIYSITHTFQVRECSSEGEALEMVLLAWLSHQDEGDRKEKEEKCMTSPI